MAKKDNNSEYSAPQEKFNGDLKNENQSSSDSGNQDEISSAPAENTDDANFEFESEESPIETPPDDSFSDTDEGFGAAVWYDNKKVTKLWSKDETRNSYAAVSGLGWKKLNSSNNTSCTALTILASHARCFNRNVKLKIDNGQVKEMYVW